MVRRFLCAAALTGILVRMPAADAVKDVLPTEPVDLVAVNYDTVYYQAGGTLEGSVMETLPNGAIRFARIGRPPTVIPPELIKQIVLHRSLADAIRLRGAQVLAAKDWRALQRVLHFVQDQLAKPAPAAAAPLRPGEYPPSTPAEIQAAGQDIARKAMAMNPSLDLLTQIAAMSDAAGDAATAIAAAKAGLLADPNWTAGYQIQFQQLTAAKDDAGLKALVGDWLAHQPTAVQPNRWLAAKAEADGDLVRAADSYRKCWDLYGDSESAAGFLRCALALGRYEDIVRVGKPLVADDGKLSPAQGAAARLALGTAYLGQESPALAQIVDLLEKALAANTLDAAGKDLATYNLALARWRLHQVPEARKLWRQVSHPMGAAALAWSEGRAVTTGPLAVGGKLPPAIAAWAAEHNAAVDLMQQQTTTVPELPGRAARQAEMAQFAQVLRTGGSEDSLRPLVAQRTTEALRWRIYGLLLAGRTAELEPLLAQLGEADGWGLAVRVHLAAVRKDQIQARQWWTKLQAAPDAPKDYVTRLGREFAAEYNEEITEAFDWPDEDAPGLGYVVSAAGTGIAIHARQGKLHLKGTQGAGKEATSAVFRSIPADRFQFAQVQIERAAGAIAGLELADEERRNAIQVGMQPGGDIAWRLVSDGTPGKWTVLGPGKFPKIEVDKGKFVVAAADSPIRQSVVAPLTRSQKLTVGVFCTAEPGAAVSVLADNLVIDLARNAAGTSGKTSP